MVNAHKVSLPTLVLSSWLGNTIEFYDFLLYGLAAALFFGTLFFPDTLSPGSRTLAAFATFGVGFMARPLGAIIFGYFGDTRGRKKTLVLTLLGMGTCTIMMGLLPTYNQIGISAPIMLTILRFLQGMIVGGEWGGAMLMVIEEAPMKYRGVLTAISQSGGFFGQLLATGAFALVMLLSPQNQMAWGWRLPFLFSVVLIGISAWVRYRTQETLVFKTSVLSAPRINPFIQAWRVSWRSIIRIMLMRAESVLFYLATVFTVSYATVHLHVSGQNLLYVIAFVCFMAFPAHVFFGALSDRFGRKYVYLFGSLFAAGFIFPFFLLIQTGHFLFILLSYFLLINVAHNAMNAAQPALFSELFGPKIRYSGMSMGAQFGVMLFGGMTPFIAQKLSLLFHATWVPVAIYTAIMALITTCAVYLGPETFSRDLTVD